MERFFNSMKEWDACLGLVSAQQKIDVQVGKECLVWVD